MQALQEAQVAHKAKDQENATLLQQLQVGYFHVCMFVAQRDMHLHWTWLSTCTHVVLVLLKLHAIATSVNAV